MLRLMRMCVWNSMWYGFHIGHFDINEISFRLNKYHVNTTQNEMPTHVHQNIRSFLNAAEIKFYVNRTCFHAGLKSQTCMSSFRLPCESTLKENKNICVCFDFRAKYLISSEANNKSNKYHVKKTNKPAYPWSYILMIIVVPKQYRNNRLCSTRQMLSKNPANPQ